MALSPIVKRKPVFTTVADLEPATHGHNLVVKVVSRELILERERADGSTIRIGAAQVADETGIVTFSARNEQLDFLEPGNYLVIRNSKIIMFKNRMRLAVDRWGKIEKATDPVPDFEPNLENDRGAIEFELVTVF